MKCFHMSETDMSDLVLSTSVLLATGESPEKNIPQKIKFKCCLSSDISYHDPLHKEY